MIRNDFIESNDIELSGESSSFIIDVEDIESESKLWKASIDIYSNKFRFITEVTSNAYDATVEKAEQLGIDVDTFLKDNPIVITLDEDQGGKYIMIEETNGIGISPNRIKDVYLKLGKTTKDKSVSQIGSKGLGKFSALAYTDKFFITTRHEGIESSYVIYKYTDIVDSLGNKKQYIKPRLIETYTDVPTDKSGTVFKCYISEFYPVVDYIEKHLAFFNSVYLKSNKVNSTFNERSLLVGEHFIISSNSPYRNYINLVLEKVPYEISFSELGIKPIWDNFTLRFNTSELSVNQSRELILYNKVSFIYDNNDNLVIDVDSAFDNGKLKDGYYHVIREVKDVILEKIDLAQKEIHEVLRKKYEGMTDLKEFFNAVKKGCFINGTRVDIEFQPSFKDFTLGRYASDFAENDTVYFENIYEVFEKSVVKKNMTHNPFLLKQTYRVNKLDNKTRAYLRERHPHSYVITPETRIKFNLPSLPLINEILFFENQTYSRSKFTKIKQFFKTYGSKTGREILRFAKYLLDEVANFEQITVPDDYKIKRIKGKRIDKTEAVYYTFHYGKLDKNSVLKSSLLDIIPDNKTVFYTTRGFYEIEILKNLDAIPSVRVIILAESYHSIIKEKAHNLDEFMENPEKFEIGKQIAISYTASTIYRKISRLKSLMKHYRIYELDAALTFFINAEKTFPLSREQQEVIHKKVKENEPHLFKESNAQLEVIEHYLNRYPILRLVAEKDIFFQYGDVLKEGIVDYIINCLKLQK